MFIILTPVFQLSGAASCLNRRFRFEPRTRPETKDFGLFYVRPSYFVVCFTSDHHTLLFVLRPAIRLRCFVLRPTIRLCCLFYVRPADFFVSFSSDRQTLLFVYGNHHTLLFLLHLTVIICCLFYG